MTVIIITMIISTVVGVIWAHSIAEADPNEIERECEENVDGT